MSKSEKQKKMNGHTAAIIIFLHFGQNGRTLSFFKHATRKFYEFFLFIKSSPNSYTGYPKDSPK